MAILDARDVRADAGMGSEAQAAVQASPFTLRDLLRPPSLISMARLPLAAAFVSTLGRPGASLAVVALAAATDLADGWVARTFALESATGAAMDPLMDKTFLFVVFASLVRAGRLSPAEALLLAVRDVAEVPLLARAVARGPAEVLRERRSNWPGKLATASQFAASLALFAGVKRRTPWVVAAAALGALAAATYYERELARAD
ncbi:MAG TPA: CDP-alcohol phosphatidyltransferase family protein [Minicystis sp.]|nr:CDP-alcohol phosphatidyltransferase family protein [Minicystis sp.]